MNFTVEEINLMCMYNISSREILIADMKQALPYVDETGFCELIENIIIRLEKITDADFKSSDFMSDYDDLEEV